MISNYFSVHSHSHFSALDGMTPVPVLVERAAALGHPAMALTDHGTMAGTVQLYKACREHGILPFPGVEGYLIDPAFDGALEDSSKAGRFHFGLLALSEDGYKALVKFVSRTHTRPRFSRFPRCTLADLAALGRKHGKDLALTTGCYFGYVQQTLVDLGESQAHQVVGVLARWFPHLFVEVQAHETENDDGTTDADLNLALFRIAADLDLPVVAGQDSHYTKSAERPAHNLMKRMVGGMNEFPGDSYHLASPEWVSAHYPDDQQEILSEGHTHLLSLNRVKIKYLDTYTAHVPQLSEDPLAVISNRCWHQLDEYLRANPKRDRGEYKARLHHELDVIGAIGQAGYIEFEAENVRWIRSKGYCIEARGSANGSLVCFLLGITQVDPIEWGVLFERFISRDRKKPPDIDMDIEDVYQDAFFRYLEGLYDTMRIGTYAQLGMTVDKETGEERGSVFRTWLSYKRRQCEQEGIELYEDGGIRTKAEAVAWGKRRFQEKYGHIQSMYDVRTVDKDEYFALRKLADMECYKSYGVHPGGVLLSTKDANVRDWVPTMLVASSNTEVSQYDMDDVEELGFQKLDILAQKTLTAMRLCQQYMGREDPTDFTWIPLDDPAATALLRTGRQKVGIFHFDGYTKSKGGKEMFIKTSMDSVHATALYMPATTNLNQRAIYLRRRKSNRPEPHQVDHPAFIKALASTNGALIFQDQVLEILRDMGMDIPGINTFFKIVKSSGKGAVEANLVRLEGLKADFMQLAKSQQVPNAEFAWQLLSGFAAYGFGKAHSAGYGLRSYRCAYLKAHYPLEYMAGLLWAYTRSDNENYYALEARRMNVDLLPPCVNVSGERWTLDRSNRAIRKGLTGIPGFGVSKALEIVKHQKYRTVDDFVFKVSPRVISGVKAYLDPKSSKLISGDLLKLQEANAFDALLGEDDVDETSDQLVPHTERPNVGRVLMRVKPGRSRTVRPVKPTGTVPRSRR